MPNKSTLTRQIEQLKNKNRDLIDENKSLKKQLKNSPSKAENYETQIRALRLQIVMKDTVNEELKKKYNGLIDEPFLLPYAKKIK